MVQEEIWREYSTKYDVMAYDEVSQVESNHLLFVLLTIPLMQHDGDSLFVFALEQKRIEFLNNNRINSSIQHLYQHRFLAPDKDINMTQLSYYQLLKLVFAHPFKFYFTAQGCM